MSTVLIVDDSPVDRRLAGGILEKCSGMQVEYAANGAEALAKIEQHAPDLVLSDLQMPQVDGLELVGAVRSRFPLVPVILMTAHGSEDIAVQALARGAASYVPKSKLAQELPEVIESVLAVSKADRHNEQLGECLHRTTNEFVLKNDTSLVYPLVDHCQRLVTRMRLCDDTGRIRIGIALEEALLNALYHGNLELTADALREARSGMVSDGNNLIEQRRNQSPFRERRIHFHVSVSPEEAKFVVRDEGPGFNPASVPDPTDPANLERESGRGLLLMRSFMDVVEYTSNGNQVTLLSGATGKFGLVDKAIRASTRAGVLLFVYRLPIGNLSLCGSAAFRAAGKFGLIDPRDHLPDYAMRFVCTPIAVLSMVLGLAPDALGVVDLAVRRPVQAALVIPHDDPLTSELAYSPAEPRLFADASDGHLDEIPLLDAALVACGIEDSLTIERCRRSFAAVCEEMNQAAARASTTTDRMEIVHRVLHERLLAGGYDANATDLAETLRSGVYNCASATVLWIAAASEIKLDARAVEMPGHVRVIVKCDDDLHEIEATCPCWSEAMRSVPPFGPRAHTEPAHRECAGATGSASAATPRKANTGGASGTLATAEGGREISSAGLLAMIYYNRGIDAFHEGRFAEAVALNRRALLLDAENQTARGNLLASINNWALALSDAGQFNAAESLLAAGRRFDPNHAAFVHNAAHIQQLRRQSQNTSAAARSTSE